MVNKNDDDLHIEVIELNHDYGYELIGKAHSIIMSQEAPARIAQSEAFHTCKYCVMKDICFNLGGLEKNCRSCKHASPVPDAQWFCGLHEGEIPKDFIKTGCEQWESIV